MNETKQRIREFFSNRRETYPIRELAGLLEIDPTDLIERLHEIECGRPNEVDCPTRERFRHEIPAADAIEFALKNWWPLDLIEQALAEDPDRSYFLPANTRPRTVQVTLPEYVVKFIDARVSSWNAMRQPKIQRTRNSYLSDQIFGSFIDAELLAEVEGGVEAYWYPEPVPADPN